MSRKRMVMETPLAADTAASAAVASEPPQAATAEPEHPLSEFLPQSEIVPSLPSSSGLHSATLTSLDGRHARILFRGRATPVAARVAPEVEPELVAEALPGGTVMVEADERGELLIVGVLATRRPRELRLRAGAITIEGDDEVFIRAGRSAIRLRADGDLEVVGSRISASSRGLFKIVGRLLRLN